MMARLLRNAKIPNGTLEPATVRLIIEVVESLVATGTSGRVTYVIVFDRCSHRRANPVYHSNQKSVVLQLQHTIYSYYYL